MSSEKAYIIAAWSRGLLSFSLAHTEQEQLKTWNPTPESFQGGATPTSKYQPSHAEVRERVILMKFVWRSSAQISSPADLAPVDVGSMAPVCCWASHEVNTPVLSQSEAQAEPNQRNTLCSGFNLSQWLFSGNLVEGQIKKGCWEYNKAPS